jgi:hypothetical protein
MIDRRKIEMDDIKSSPTDHSTVPQRWRFFYSKGGDNDMNTAWKGTLEGLDAPVPMRSEATFDLCGAPFGA